MRSDTRVLNKTKSIFLLRCNGLNWWTGASYRLVQQLPEARVQKRTVFGVPCRNLGNYRYFAAGWNISKLSKFPAVCDIRYGQIANYTLSARRYEDAKSLADKTVQILSESKRKETEKLKKAEEKKQTEQLKRASGINEAAQSEAPQSELLRSEIFQSRPTPSAPSKSGTLLSEQSDEPHVQVTRAVDATNVDACESSQVTLAKRPLHIRAWRIIVKEAKHYYHGFRLLFIDVKICTRYIWGVLNGKSLTRRERKQLVRTTADLFRLVPFMVFLIVPFMEFLLPVALKLFPGLLPSTFAVSNKEKEKVKKRLKAKLEIAKFLQDTVEESALVKTGSGQHTELAREFQTFITEIREGGITAQTSDILKFTQLFTDDITLDNMTRDHLIALCKLLELNTIGTTKMIAFQLRLKLRTLKADDRMIKKEGVGILSEAELQVACRARGMRSVGVPEWRLRYQLNQWLAMHLDDKIPISLLLMSRALYLPDTLSKEEQLKTIISTLPENTTAEAEIHAAEVTGEKIDPAAKIKLIRAEEEAIARERQEEAEDMKEKLAKSKPAEVLSEQEDLAKHTIEDKAELIEATSKADVVFTEDISPPTVKGSSAKLEAAKAAEVEPVAADQELSSQDIEELEDVLEQIAEEKKIDIDKSSLDALKEDVDEYKEDLSQLQSLVERDAQIVESKSAKRLSSAVNKMIGNMTSVTDELHRQKQHLLQEIEVKQVRMKRNEELQHDQEARQNMQDAIEKGQDDVISINELVLSMKRLQKIPDDTRLQKIAEVLDEDKDGQVNISLVLRVLQEIGTENVNIKGSEMTAILGLLKTEDELEKEDNKENRNGIDGPSPQLGNQRST